MYSNNDWRDYLERRCYESDDFLMHYGVKGMKWKHRKKVSFEKTNRDGIKDYRIDFNKHKNWSDGIGIQYDSGKKSGERSLTFYNTTKTKKDKKTGDYIYEKKAKGRVTKERAEDGVRYTVDLDSKKKRRKKKFKNAVKNVSFSTHRGIYSIKDKKRG